MKITSFQPMILESTASSTDVQELFESIGFEVKHNKNTNDDAWKAFNLKNEDGFKLSIVKSDRLSQTGLSKTTMAISMNVDNLTEAVEFFEKNGFVNKLSDSTHGNTTSILAMMVNTDGIVIILAQHLK